MSTESAALVAKRLRFALDMYVTGEALMRQNLARRNPLASESELSVRLAKWLRERPGAPLGDSAGRQTGWPRSR